MTIVYQILDRVSKRLIDLDPDTRRKLSALDGTVIRIDLTAPVFTLFMIPGEQGIEIAEKVDGDPDVMLSGPLSAFIRLAAQGAKSDVLSGGTVTMEGNAEAGQVFQRIVAQFDLDWEELLSGYIGDMPSRKLGNVLRNIDGWVAQSASLTRENLGDYLKEEKRWLVTPLAIERHENAVNRLREEVDRIEQKVDRLTRSISRSGHAR